MANFIQILMGSNKTKSDCCNIEMKEVQETEEKKEACCGGDSTCC